MAKKKSVRTSKKVASLASDALRSARSSAITKKLAGQSLGNRKKTSKK